MKLWLLRPVDGLAKNDNPWEPWYDKAFGFVVRADTEGEARKLAHADAGDEAYGGRSPWLDAAYSTCGELMPEGPDGVVVQEKHDALAECKRLRELLAGAHAQIRSFYLGTPEVRLAAALKERDWLHHDAMRALVAWDGTVLPKARDCLLQERMESLRASLADLGA